MCSVSGSLKTARDQITNIVKSPSFFRQPESGDCLKYVKTLEPVFTVNVKWIFVPVGANVRRISSNSVPIGVKFNAAGVLNGTKTHRAWL